MYRGTCFTGICNLITQMVQPQVDYIFANFPKPGKQKPPPVIKQAGDDAGPAEVVDTDYVRDMQIDRMLNHGPHFSRTFKKLYVYCSYHTLQETLDYVLQQLESTGFKNAWLNALSLVIIHHPKMQEAKIHLPEFHLQARFHRYSEFKPQDWKPPAEPGDLTMTYFRDDSEFNRHHLYFHYVHYHRGIPADPDANTYRLTCDRQGELFFYTHMQMLARYRLDLYCWRLPDLNPVFGLDEKPEDVPGFDPPQGLTSANSNWPFPFVSRPAKELPKSLYIPKTSTAAAPEEGRDWQLENIRRYLDNALKCIESGTLPDGTPLTYHMLGSLFEANFTVGHLEEYFGAEGMHNAIHDLWSSVGQSADSTNYGVMGQNSDAVRDPLFFRLHMFVDNIRQLYVDKCLPPNDFELHRPKDITISSFGCSPDGELHTVLGPGMYAHERGKLSHTPFFWRIGLKCDRKDISETNPREVTARIFMTALGKEEDPRFWVEMDKFTVLMTSPSQEIVRKSSESSIIRRHRSGDVENSQRWCDCGWPAHMLVPIGRPEGMVFLSMVMITCDDRISNTCSGCCNKAADPSNLIVYCNSLSKGLYPDKLGMGYPFDRKFERPIIDTLRSLSNVAMHGIQIFNENKIAVGDSFKMPIPTPGDSESVVGYHSHIYWNQDIKEDLDWFLENIKKQDWSYVIQIGRIHEKPVGPHPTPSCQVFWPRSFAERVIPWISFNRKRLTVFTHPISGDEVIDHFHNCIWMGKKLPLNEPEKWLLNPFNYDFSTLSQD